MRKIFAELCLVTLMAGAVSAETENLTIDSYSIGREYILTAQTLPIYQTAEKFTEAVCLIHGTASRGSRILRQKSRLTSS